MRNVQHLRPLTRRLARLLSLPLQVLLLVAATSLTAAGPAHASAVLNNLQQVAISDGTSNTVGDIWEFSGDVSVTCDGSVRSISGNTVTCGDGSVRTISGSTPLDCLDGGSNNLQQLGTQGSNNLQQIGLAVHNFGTSPSVVCDDGSVREAGSRNAPVSFILPFLEQTTLCFDHVSTIGSIHDGTQNTIFFGERAGLQTTPGFLSAHQPIRDITDGTSNTIFFGELPSSQYCFGNTTIGDPVGSGFGDGGTVDIGGGTFDVCFKSARIGIADGTSNTILFGELQSDVCIEDVSVGAGLANAGAVPEPGSMSLVLAGSLATLGLRLSVARRRGFSLRSGHAHRDHRAAGFRQGRPQCLSRARR